MTVPVPDQLEYISDADGTTTDFPYPKRFLQSDEIIVVLRDADGVDTRQHLNQHYSIAGSSWPNGSSVSFNNAPAAGLKVVLTRMTQAKQSVDLANKQRNDAKAVELQLDRLTMAIQDRAALTDKARALAIASSIGLKQEIVDRENGDEALKSLIGQAGPIEVPFYDTFMALQSAKIKQTINAVRTGGFAVSGDGGAAEYKRVESGTLNNGRQRSADGALWEISSRPINLLQLGADPSGNERSVPALDAFVDIVGRNGSPLLLPYVREGIYNFGTSAPTNFQDIHLVPDEGVVIRGLIYMGDGAFVSEKPVTLDFRVDTGVRYPIDYVGRANKPANEKLQWLSNGDLDRPVANVVNVLADTDRYTLPIGGDTLVADETASATFNEVTYNLPENLDGLWHCADIGVKGGDEINAVFPLTAENYHRGVIIRCSGGYVVFTAQFDGSITQRVKPIGAAETVSTGIWWPGAVDHASYLAGNCMWTIRVIDYQTVSILLNGYEVVNNYKIGLLGHLHSAGFVVATAAKAAFGTQIAYWSRITNSAGNGKPNIRLLTFGDSKTSDGTDTWPKQVRNHLEYSFGAQVETLQNFAISGDNSGQQLARMQENFSAVQNATDVVIAVGTNDVQGGMSVAASMNNIAEMIDLVQSAGRRCVIVIYETWYPKSLNYLAQGEDTFNYEKGAPYRAGLLRLVAQKQVSFVDLQQCFPPILGHYTNPNVGSRDILVRDNLHQSNLGYQIYAWHIARAVAANMKPAITRHVPETVVPQAYLANGWAQTSPSLTFTVTDNGICFLAGHLNAGIKTNGTIIAVLPRNLRPKSNKSWVCRTDTSEAPVVTLQPDGNLIINGMSAATVLAIMGATFELTG